MMLSKEDSQRLVRHMREDKPNPLAQAAYERGREVNFDIESMKESIESGVINIPKGLNREDRRAYVKAKLAEIES